MITDCTVSSTGTTYTISTPVQHPYDGNHVPTIPSDCKRDKTGQGPRFFIKWEGDWVVVDSDYVASERRFGVLDHAVDHCRKANAKFGNVKLKPLKGAIRKSQARADKWIVGDTIRNRDVVFDTYAEAREYVDSVNRRIDGYKEGALNPYTGTVNPKLSSSEKQQAVDDIREYLDYISKAA